MISLYTRLGDITMWSMRRLRIYALALGILSVITVWLIPRPVHPTVEETLDSSNDSNPVITASRNAQLELAQYPEAPSTVLTATPGVLKNIEFWLVNPTLIELHITNLHASCGCSTPVSDAPTIGPLGKTRVLIPFKSSQVGVRSISIMGDTELGPFIRKYSIDVSYDINIDPDELDFGIIDATQNVISRSVKLTSRGGDPFVVHDVVCDIQEVKVVPRERYSDTEAVFLITLDPVKMREIAKRRATLTITTSSLQRSQLIIPLTWAISSRSIFAPESLFLSGHSKESKTVRFCYRTANSALISHLANSEPLKLTAVLDKERMDHLFSITTTDSGHVFYITGKIVLPTNKGFQNSSLVLECKPIGLYVAVPVSLFVD